MSEWFQAVAWLGFLTGRKEEREGTYYSMFVCMYG